MRPGRASDVTGGRGPGLEPKTTGRLGAPGRWAGGRPPPLPRHPQRPQVPRGALWELQALPWQILVPQMVPELPWYLFLSGLRPGGRQPAPGLLPRRCASFFPLPRSLLPVPVFLLPSLGRRGGHFLCGQRQSSTGSARGRSGRNGDRLPPVFAAGIAARSPLRRCPCSAALGPSPFRGSSERRKHSRLRFL